MSVVVFIEAIAAFLAIAGMGCIVGGFIGASRRLEPAKRLAPYQVGSVADEAHRWLQNQT